MAGRLPKPLGMHIIEGTFREDRHGPTDDGCRGTPQRPRPLTGDAKKFWETTIADLIERGIVKAVDGPACELLADLWARYKAAGRLLDANPTDPQARQAVKQFAELFMRLAARFGLTPCDRMRLPTTPVATTPVVSSRQRRPDTTGDGSRTKPTPSEWRQRNANAVE